MWLDSVYQLGGLNCIQMNTRGTGYNSLYVQHKLNIIIVAKLMCPFVYHVSIWLNCNKYATSLDVNFLLFQIPGIGLLELPSLPDTSLTADKNMAYAAGGLLIEVVEPMKKWKLSFSGKR